MRSTITLVVSLLVAAHASSQNWQAKLGSIDEYLMDEGYEVALARSAAPEHVSKRARLLVLRKDGYHEVAAGTNGFTCLVERSWSSPIGPHRDFFNRELRAPICYNDEASRTILGDYLRRTELVLGGSSIGDVREAIERDIGTGMLRAPHGFAMSYMLSGGQRLGSEVGRFKPHLMIYVPYTTPEQLGSPPAGCEHVCIFEHAGGPLAALILPMKEFNEVSIPSPHHEGDDHR